MKVAQLIEVLKRMPKDADVFHLWDGEPRTRIEYVWLSKNGRVITSDVNKVCYSTENRPLNAPTKEEKQYWGTEDLRY